MNAKFSRPAVSGEGAHAPLLDVNLTGIFCFEYGRAVSSGCAVRFENRLFQITKENQNRPQPAKPVCARKKLDSALTIIWLDKLLKIIEILPQKEAGRLPSNAA